MTPRRYSGNVSAFTNTSGAPMGDIGIPSATFRPALYDINIGSTATPADNACEYQIFFNTAARSGGTSVGSVALDTADPAALATFFKGTYGTAPTKGAVALLEIPLNMRAAFRWVATPGAEFIAAAATTSGHQIFSNSNNPSAFPASWSWSWAE